MSPAVPWQRCVISTRSRLTGLLSCTTNSISRSPRCGSSWVAETAGITACARSAARSAPASTTGSGSVSAGRLDRWTRPRSCCGISPRLSVANCPCSSTARQTLSRHCYRMVSAAHRTSLTGSQRPKIADHSRRTHARRQPVESGARLLHRQHADGWRGEVGPGQEGGSGVRESGAVARRDHPEGAQRGGSARRGHQGQLELAPDPGGTSAPESPAVWTARYLRGAAAADVICTLAAGVLALLVRFDGPHLPRDYLIFSFGLPVLWLVAASLSGAYDARFIGVGSDEFRRVFNAALSLTAAVAILSYATKTQVARGYVVIALPSATVFVLVARYLLRKRLHRMRRAGLCMRRAVAVGHRGTVHSLITEFRRDHYHGLQIVAVCLPDGRLTSQEVGGVVVYGNLNDVALAVQQSNADTVAVLACPEMDGIRLRTLAWELEKTGTDLCVAPALMDVAGPRTTIRPVAGLPLLHVDHPELAGARQVLKAMFDKTCAAVALLMLAPLLVVIAILIRSRDGGPVLFRQTRVGKNGRMFTVNKFRTMVVDAEERKAQLAAAYGDYVRRRLAVTPGLTGLWQVNGRSDLSWEESVRLDLRYVENWSFALDLQILWKTWSAVLRGSGAY